MKFLYFFSAIILFSAINASGQVNRRNTKSSIPYRANYQRMASGCSSDQSFEIREGTLWAWGLNNYGQLGDSSTTNRNSPVQVGTDNDWVTVTSGPRHTLAIKANGTLWGWGENYYGQVGDSTNTNRVEPVQVGIDSNWISVSVGNYHSIGIKADGTLWAWGRNLEQQLGDSSTTNRNYPIQIGSSRNWTSISAAGFHTHALQANGTLWAWGNNSYGNLGDSTTNNAGVPIRIGNDNNWIFLYAGYFHTFGIKSNGTLWGWGYNSVGELGDSTTTQRKYPVKIGNDNNWVMIAAGYNHTLALKSNGTLWSWGYNWMGQLGDSTTTSRYYPMKVGKDSNWVSIYGGYYHSLGLKANGQLFGWGYNWYGQLGIGNNSSKSSPTIIDSIENLWIMTSTGAASTFGLKSDGSIWAWGYNGYYNLGDGTNIDRKLPHRIGNDNDWVSIVNVSNLVGFAIKSNGTLWGWGYNVNGTIGDGTDSTRSRPVRIGFEDNWVSISTYSGHALALKSNGTLWAWGYNSDGQLGDGTDSTRFAPIQVGFDSSWISLSSGSQHSLALKADGTLWAWGRNRDNELGYNGGNVNEYKPVKVNADQNWLVIYGGQRYSMGLKSDGTLWAWGDNGSYQHGGGGNGIKYTPQKIGSHEDWLSMSTGDEISIGLKCNGALYASGSNNIGQFGNGTTNNYSTHVKVSSEYNWVQISIHSAHSVGTKSDRLSFCASGYNVSGQLGDGTTNNRSSFTCNTNCDIPKAAIDSSSNVSKTICSGDYTTLHAVGTGKISWYTDSISGTYIDSGNYFTTPNLYHNTTYYVQDSTCGPSDKRTAITVTVRNLPSANVGTSKTICAGSSTSIGSSGVSGNIYNWTSIPSGFSDTTSNPTVSPTSTTKYFLAETNVSTGCSKTDSVTITVNPLPSIYAGTSITICKGDTVTLGATSINGHSYSWTSKPSGFSSASSQPLVTPSVSTIYYLSQTITATSCSKIDSVSITVNPLPDAKVIADQSICKDDSIYIGDTAINGHSYSWSSIPTGFTSSSSNPLVSPQSTTQYFLTETITNTGCKKTDSITITVNPLPQANVANSQTICAGDSINIGSSALNGNTYSWISNPVGFNSSIADPKVSPSSTTIYILTETIASTGCAKTDSLTITVNPLPVAIAGNDQSFCEGDSVNIGDTAMNGHTYVWSSSPSGFNSNSANPIVKPTTTTTYYLTETITTTGCKQSDTVIITVNQKPTTNAGADQTICYLDSTDIGSSQINGYTYSWTSIPVGFTSSIASPRINPSTNTTYYLIETISATGCTNNDSVNIYVNKPGSQLNITACNNYIFNSDTLTTSGVYYDTLTSYTNCDSVVTLSLTINQKSSSVLNVTTCNSFVFNGSIYTSSGSYYDTLVNASGCDSIIQLDLTINFSNSTTINDTSCGNYIFDGKTLTSSGTYYDTLMNITGCDSVVMLNLIVNPTNFNLSFTQNTQVFTSPPFEVLFLNTTPNKSNYNFEWLFGDGTIFNGTNPSKHTYSKNGSYDVTLIAMNQSTGCFDTLYRDNWILCTGACSHNAIINQTQPPTKCIGDSVYLSCNSGQSYTYEWLFNGNKITGAVDSFIYVKTAGQYSVNITDNGCKVTSSPVKVSFYPSLKKPEIYHSGNLTFCTGGSVLLYTDSIYNSYLWNTTETTPKVNIGSSGNYYLQVNDSNGCEAVSDTFKLNASYINPPSICIVGVDSTSNKNIIVWEKHKSAIDSFLILKETNQAGQYSIIKRLTYSSFSTWIDTTSNPDVQASRYKISAVDTCGIATLPGDLHKTIHLTISKGQGTNWNLIWSHYEGISFPSYNIYRGDSKTNITLLTTIASNLNSYTDVNPPSSNLYYQIEVVSSASCNPSFTASNYSSSRSNIVDNGKVGIQEVNSLNFCLFPNPAKENVTFQTDQILTNAIIRLIDVSGKVVITRSGFSGTTAEFDLSGLASGIYIFECAADTYCNRVKLVIVD